MDFRRVDDLQTGDTGMDEEPQTTRTRELDSVLGSQNEWSVRQQPTRETEQTAEPEPTVELDVGAFGRRTKKPARATEDDVSTGTPNRKRVLPTIPLSTPQNPVGQAKKRKVGTTNAEPSSATKQTPAESSRVMAPPQRRAAQLASKKNHDMLEFYRQTPRAQSRAIEEGKSLPFATCSCAELDCEICGPIERVRRFSSTVER
jgi:hypothetical protein